MKYSSLPVLLLWIFTTIGLAQPNTKFVPLPFEKADHLADSILYLMTLDEKLNYIGGHKIFFTQEIKRLGIPSLSFVDATQGVRINPALLYKGWKKPLDKSIAYPSPILLASTWNRNIVWHYAFSIGEECRAANLPVLLGPGFNLYRNSQCGRNFEYMGEDPYLVGNMVAQFVTGLQETGTIATLKHFIANQTDYYRKKSNSILDERTLHEIYLRPYKYGIDAGARAVMTSYNLVNGEWAGQSEYMINQLLREELGFQWLVMTDWFSVWDGEKVIKSGQDLEMPFRKATKDADKLLQDGIISEDDIDRMTKNILRTFISMGSFTRKKQPLSDADYRRLEEISLNTAREGIILLRNDKQLLPLDKSKKQNILVTGKFLEERAAGRGAANVKGYKNISVMDALILEFGDQINFVKKPSAEQLKKTDVILLSVGTIDREATDHPFDLPEEQERMIHHCSKLNPNTVVIVTSGGGINMSHWKDVGAIIYTWYMGQNGATALAEIMSGKINPSGKLPITIEKRFEDSPAFGYIPEGEELYRRPRMIKEKKHDVYDIHYHEGIFAGYRWYEHQKIEPLFCFGHGLSYTTFEYSDLELSAKQIPKTGKLTIKLSIQNTGQIYGAEIVQLYVSDLACSVERPLKELKSFKKVFLEAGATKEIAMVLNPEDFAFWHPESREWTVESGEFELLIGASSQDIRLKQSVIIQ